MVVSVGLERSGVGAADSESIASLADAIAARLAPDAVVAARFNACLLQYGAPRGETGYICFDLNWHPRPAWSLVSWNPDAWLLDMDPSSGVRVPSEVQFLDTDVVEGSVEFDLRVRCPVHAILHAENPAPLDGARVRQLLGDA